MAVSFAGALRNNYCSITAAVCELKKKKKKRNTKRQCIFICLKQTLAWKRNEEWYVTVKLWLKDDLFHRTLKFH